MKSFVSYITPAMAITAVSGFLSLTEVEVAQAAQMTTRWNFDFTGEITGDGFIEVEEEQNGETTGTSEVTDLQFTLDFGTGFGSNSVTLANFPDFTKPLFFSPDNSSNELLHTNFFAQFIPGADPIQPEWVQGTINGVGGFTMSGSGDGVNTPDDPQGVGGIIIFTSNESSPQRLTGTWTAQTSSDRRESQDPTTVPESSSLISLGLLGAYLLVQIKIRPR